MRVPQSTDSRGSLRWLQRLMGGDRRLLDDSIRKAAKRDAGWTIDWVSPQEADGWAEYRDADFLKRLNLPHLVEPLSAFWPNRGPQWDVLGTARSDGTVLLVEAKAHIGELASTCGAGTRSLARIRPSLDAAKRSFGVPVETNWLEGYYQYANRLAHLHFLQAHRVPALLVFVYFVGDREMRGPDSSEEWQALLGPIYSRLGLKGSMESLGVLDVFVDVAAIP